jgi:hypothetical protein
MRAPRCLFTLLTLLSLVLGSPGCGATISDDFGPEVIDSSGKADSTTIPPGAYENIAAQADLHENEIVSLTLNDDKSFVSATWVESAAEEQSGAYSFSQSGTTRYVRLLQDGVLVARYAYQFVNQELQLRLQGTDRWSTMKLVTVAPPAPSGPCRLALYFGGAYHEDFKVALKWALRAALVDTGRLTELNAVADPVQAWGYQYMMYVRPPEGADVPYDIKDLLTLSPTFSGRVDSETFNRSVTRMADAIAADVADGLPAQLEACQ